MLASTEDELRLAFDRAPIGKALIDLEGRFVNVNSALCTVTGYSRAQMLEMTVGEVVHPDDRRHAVSFGESLRRGKDTSETIEQRVLTSSGALKLVATSGTVIHDAAGSASQFLVQVQDITVRRAEERELARERRHLRDAQHIGRSGSWELDPETGAVMWSDSMYELYGVERGSLHHGVKQGIQGVHADDRQEVSEALQACLIDGVPFRIRYRRARLSDGVLRWFDARGERLSDVNGVRVEGVVADVTERVEAERDRDRHASLLNAVVENIQSLIAVKDLDGRYVLANHPFQQALSVDAATLIGHTDDDLGDPAMAMMWRNDDGRACPGDHDIHEGVFTTRSGIAYESVTFPLRDRDGRIYATCGVWFDVTERRRANEELTEARDAAVAATAAKSVFLATMSHEIRTPMNAVIGLTELLMSTTLDEDQRNMLDTVRSSGGDLLGVINEVLDFSKIEAGELHLEHEQFNLRVCAEGALDVLAGPAAHKGLSLVLDATESCPGSVVGDSARVRQVLINLIGNAVKFTPAGEIVVTITSSSSTNGQADVQFTISDTGIGIPDDRIGALFQSFSQVDASTTRIYGGTGLGLAISRGLVRNMGGELTAASILGEGSTFTFNVVVDTHDQPNPEDSWATDELAGRTALIVDDNATNLRVLDLQLARWGVQTTCAVSPREALELIDSGSRFDVALLDMYMPEMNGDELAVALRRLPGARTMPLIMLRSLIHMIPEASDGLFAAIINKPIRLEPLYAAVLRSLRDDRPDPSVAPKPAPATPTSQVRVLLAEDNVVNQGVAKLMLRRLGYQVDIVENGEQAAAACAATDYDIVLMDIQMPVMDGLQATRAIRAQGPAGNRPSIVALTASALLEDRTASSLAGMDAYLVKPFSLEQLEAAMTAAASSVHTDELVEPLAH